MPVVVEARYAFTIFSKPDCAKITPKVTTIITATMVIIARIFARFRNIMNILFALNTDKRTFPIAA